MIGVRIAAERGDGALWRRSRLHGLGYAQDAIDAIIAERTSLSAQHRAQMPKELREGPGRPAEAEGNPSQRRNTDYGESADYLTARIARDRPDILERMAAGEYRSVPPPQPRIAPL